MQMTDTTTKDDGDWLGYGVYADTLWQRIVRALANDLINGELGDDPIVIGIFGEWGAGKSHLLKLIERKAKASLSEQKKKHESDAGFELTVPVWFQPWKYEHEEHLHVPMIIHVLNALKDALKQEATVVDTVVNTSLAVIDTGKKAAPIVKKTIEIASSAYPVIQKILKSMTVFGCNVDLPDEVGEWLETAADGVSDIELSKDAKAKVSAVDAAVKHTTDGSYFYRIHELLGALTRPQ
jgi:predicted KAP-like P-loop ATPase